MENPFVYGRYVSGEAFTDRVEELAYLVRELESNGRIFLISPRRYGKSSAAQRWKNNCVPPSSPITASILFSRIFSLRSGSRYKFQQTFILLCGKKFAKFTCLWAIQEACIACS
jgi:hypothetical protein